jgi:hypothetical protein
VPEDWRCRLESLGSETLGVDLILILDIGGILWFRDEYKSIPHPLFAQCCITTKTTTTYTTSKTSNSKNTIQRLKVDKNKKHSIVKKMYSTSYSGIHSRKHILTTKQQLRESNSLNLDRNTLGKLLDSNATTSRLVRKVLLIHAIHLCKILHVGKENSSL